MDDALAELDAATESALAKLTRKQQLFVRYYLVHLNASQAAREAGYSERSSGMIGHDNLKKPEIRTAIDLAMGRRALRIDTSADWVVQELAKNHYQAIDRKELQASNRSLELIGRHHGAFTDRIEHFDPTRLNDDDLDRRLAEVEREIADTSGAEASDTAGDESKA